MSGIRLFLLLTMFGLSGFIQSSTVSSSKRSKRVETVGADPLDIIKKNLTNVCLNNQQEEFAKIFNSLTGDQKKDAARSRFDLPGVTNPVTGRTQRPLHGWTLLHVASKNGNLDMVHQLVLAGANYLDTTTDDNVIPLAYASANGHDLVARYLSSLPIEDSEFVHSRYREALAYAAQGGHGPIVHTLLRHYPYEKKDLKMASLAAAKRASDLDEASGGTTMTPQRELAELLQHGGLEKIYSEKARRQCAEDMQSSLNKNNEPKSMVPGESVQSLDGTVDQPVVARQLAPKAFRPSRTQSSFAEARAETYRVPSRALPPMERSQQFSASFGDHE